MSQNKNKMLEKNLFLSLRMREHKAFEMFVGHFGRKNSHENNKNIILLQQLITLLLHMLLKVMVVP